VESIIQDLHFAIRTFIRNPTFTIVAVVTLGLGIGAGTAIFSAVDGVLLQPLPYDNPSELVFLGTTFDDPRPGWTSVPDFMDWKCRLTKLQSLAASQLDVLVLLGGEDPERLDMARVSPDFFSMLGAHPRPGRVFTDEEHKTGAEPVAILSHSLWERRWGSEPDMVGQVLATSRGSVKIVGIMPESFQPPMAMWLQDVDIWFPLEVDSAAYAESRGARSLRVVGRLETGVPHEVARQEVGSLARALADEHPEVYRWGIETIGIGMVPLLEMTVGDTDRDLLLLLASTGLLLLIGCANVANLLLARATHRSKEVALRSTLGAGRGRVVRQLLTESLFLAGLGGCAGVGLAFAGVRAFQILGPRDFPRLADVQVSPEVLAFACGLALLTGLLFGLAPAFQGWFGDTSASLKESGGKFTPGRRGTGLRTLLVITEIALALILLCGAGLLINSYVRLQSVDPGFRPEGLILTEVGLRSSYTSNDERARFIRELLDRARAIPGVQSAAAIADPPMGPVMWLPPVFTEGSEDREPPLVTTHLVAGRFFETMGIRLLAGRSFTSRDDDNHPGVVIVNGTMARRYWPNEDPLGRRIRLSRDPDKLWLTVVGVVNDIRHVHLNASPEPELYVPYAQNAWYGWMSIVLRTDAAPETVADQLRSALRSVDPNVPIDTVSLMNTRLAGVLSTPRFRTLLLLGFAGVALALALVGIYGAVLYTVGRRTHEVGIRLALGAGQADILRIFLGQGLVMVLSGVALGITGSVVLSRFLEGFLYGVIVTDPGTLSTAAMLLGATALFACYIPARKASRVDPASVLRSE
jgi:putative ABC transport system permease protein